MSDDKVKPIRPRDTSNDVEFGPLVSFESRPTECATCGNREFVLGFEVGLLHARLEAKPPEFSGTYHAPNRTMLEREAKAMGYSAAFEATGFGEWLFATFTKEVPRRHLSVVQAEGT